MTPREPFRLPETAYSFKSVDAFLEQSQVRLDKIAQAQGKSSSKISPQDIMVDPGEAGDGIYQLVYKNKTLDAVLLGQVSTLNQEIKLVNHRIDQPEKFFIFHYDKVEDACSLTSTLLGKEELAGMECKDGWLEPKIKNAKSNFESLTVFDRYCQKSYAKFLTEHPEFKGTGNFGLNRTVVHNPEVGDGQFNLLYHNPANDFFCRAEIPTFGNQIMAMGAGMVHDGGEQVTLIGDPETHEMTDACRMTESLVDAKEIPGTCQEFTPAERTGTQAVEYTWTGFWTALTAYEGASLLTWTADKIFKRGWYAKSFGKWPHPGRWMGRQISRPFQAMWRGVRPMGPALSNLVRQAGPAFRTIGRQIPKLGRYLPSATSLSLGARGLWLSIAGGGATATTTTATTAAVTTTTAATTTTVVGGGAATTAGGGTAAAAGSNPVGWAVAAGVVLGYGIVKTGAGKHLGLESAGNAIGDAATETFGPADTNSTTFKIVDGVFNFLGL